MKKEAKKNTTEKKQKLLLVVLLFCIGFLTGCSKDTGDSIYNFSNTEPKEIDPWVYLQDTTLSSNPQILSFASSASSLGITIGVMGITISILYMAIRILFSRNAKARNEMKEEALQKGITAVMLFSIPLWLGICKMIGELLI